MKTYKLIKGYEGLYTISEDGEVISLERDYILDNNVIGHVNRCVKKQNFNESHELIVQLSKNSVRTDHTIKSLVKEAFGNDS